MLEINTKAKDFKLLNQDKKEVKLSDYKGYVIIYFYPKDDTPGCTKEACAIRDTYDEFKKKDIKVFGISSDSPDSHTKFRKKYDLPFTLLSDPDKKVIKEYDALKSIGGTKRISYLIKDGVITKTYPNVDPASHAIEILKDIKE